MYYSVRFEIDRQATTMYVTLPKYDGDDKGDDGDHIQEIDGVGRVGGPQTIVLQSHCQHNPESNHQRESRL